MSGFNCQVLIDEYEGTITQIQLRATTMKTYDGRVVYIPNQEVFQASIINNTASPRRRSSVMVGIDYGEDLSGAIAVINKVLESSTCTLACTSASSSPKLSAKADRVISSCNKREYKR